MIDNIMFIPAVLVLLAGAGSLVFLIWAWFRDKKEAKKDVHEND